MSLFYPQAKKETLLHKYNPCSKEEWAIISELKGIVFDVDGVIADTAVLHYLSWKAEISKHGLSLSEEQNISLKGMPRKATLLAIIKLNNKEGQFGEKQVDRICQAKNAAYVRILKEKLTAKDTLPGIAKFIKECKKERLKLSVASTSVNAPLILEKLNLSHYFDFVVNPETIKKGKPDPEIYLKACEGIGLQHDEVVGIEDALPGIAGLNEAKIFAVAITHNDPGEWHKADLVLSDTSELDLAIIKSQALKNFSKKT